MNPSKNNGQPGNPLPPRIPVPIIDEKQPHVSPPSRSETIREIISTIGVLLAALLVAFGLIAWVFQSYEVDGPSMETTLNNQDRLIVWKVPRTISRITGKPYVPKRGEVIIFVESGLTEFGSSSSKQLIKRVVGLPGDHVVIQGGKITIYNDEHPEGFEPDKSIPFGHIVPEESDVRDLDVTVRKNQVFVCGDNRPNSLDSRTFGPIEVSQIVGKLSLRLLPVSQIEKF
jgi:signal peptidase I